MLQKLSWAGRKLSDLIRNKLSCFNLLTARTMITALAYNSSSGKSRLEYYVGAGPDRWSGSDYRSTAAAVAS